MACEFWAGKLDLYVDGELTPPEAQEFSAHLRSCASCAAEALERVQFKRSVALAGKRYEPSAEFRAKIQKAVGAEPKRQAAWFWRIVGIPAALVLMLSLAVNWYVDREKAHRERIYGELADLHVTTLASATPVDVISEDRHTVKPWFQGKIPFSFNLPELLGTDFSLVGGRVTYLAQAPGAQLIYRIRKHEISVFIFQDRGNETATLPSGPVSTMSFNVESWTKNGLRYFVVGDVSGEDIERLSKLLHDAG
jgi:anti-sigma factor RsiW